MAVVRLRRPDEHPWAMDEAFDAIEAWLAAAGQSVVYRVWQRRRAPSPATYIGRGKALQLRALCERGQVEAVIVDGTPTPAQRSNLERLLDRPIVDRTVWPLPAATAPAIAKTRKLHRRAWRLRGVRNLVLLGCAGAGKSTLFAALTHGLRSAPSWPPSTERGRPVVVTKRLRGAWGGRAVFVTDTRGLIWDPERGLWTVPPDTKAEWDEADVVVHVIDAAHPEAARRANHVGRLLASGGTERSAPVIPVWTQADRVSEAARHASTGWMVSGRTGSECDNLIAHLSAVAAGA